MFQRDSRYGPASDDQLVNHDMEAEIHLLREVITAIRGVRSDMDIDPGKFADLIVRGPEMLTRILGREITHLQRMTRVDKLATGVDITKPPHAATAVVDALELFIPLEGLIDIEVERERLDKRIHEMEGRLAAVQKKLDNKAFLQRAPAEVVIHEQEKQAAYQDRLNKLRESFQAVV